MFQHVLVMRRDVNKFNYGSLNFHFCFFTSIGKTRKKAVSESKVIRDSDSSQKGILDIIIIVTIYLVF